MTNSRVYDDESVLRKAQIDVTKTVYVLQADRLLCWDFFSSIGKEGMNCKSDLI